MLLGGSIVKPLFILNLGFGDSLFLVEVILTDLIAVCLWFVCFRGVSALSMCAGWGVVCTGRVARIVDGVLSVCKWSIA